MIRSVAFSWVYMNRVCYEKTLNREITRQSRTVLDWVLTFRLFVLCTDDTPHAFGSIFMCGL